MPRTKEFTFVVETPLYRPGKDGAGNPERSPPDGARDGSGRRKVRLYI